MSFTSLTSFEHVLRSDNLSPTAEGKQGGCLPSFPSRQPLPPPVSQLHRWIVSGSHRGDSSPPDTRRDPRPPRRLRRASAPLPSAYTDQLCWTQRPEQHSGGCRPSFSLALFSPHPYARLSRCSSCRRWTCAVGRHTSACQADHLLGQPREIRPYELRMYLHRGYALHPQNAFPAFGPRLATRSTS